ncbi:DUF4056 domain-containing protein [Erwinia sp.]|uniref:DUF4056 domain-containing protein n=1 Tax=Erwinia citreus TaxID=558 RepID=UPI003C746C34
MRILFCLSWLLFSAVTHAVNVDLFPLQKTDKGLPVIQHLSAPESLRPCCAFGYDLHVRAAGIPIPVYQIGNILTVETLGSHRFNDSSLAALENIAGISQEKNGLIYTHRGGFIDIAHVRDTADNTLFLFSKIAPLLGHEQRFFLTEELGVRRVQMNAFTAPTSSGQRYTLAAWLAGHLAFELAQWHEVAQWYGFQSVPGFSEEISAFSPEDLYSNLLGARIAIQVILQGHAGTLAEYNHAMDKQLITSLIRLEATPKSVTAEKFRQIDGVWWNSKRRVPDKFLVLNRNYDLSEQRYPMPVSFEAAPPYLLTFPEHIGKYSLKSLGELQIYSGHQMKGLPEPAHFYNQLDFVPLAVKAKEADDIQLQKLNK